MPLSQLEEEWATAGFVRIHRSLLVAMAYVDEVRVDGGRCTVVIGDAAPPGQPAAHPRAARPARPQRAARRGGVSHAAARARPARVRVTSPWTERPRVRPRPTATSEIDAQSEVGEIYMRSLLRAQLRLALSILLALGLTVGALPLLFTSRPG